MSSTREPSDDGSAKTKGAPERAAAPPPTSPSPHVRGDRDPRRAPTAGAEEAEDLTLEADERIQTTGDVAGMSETME
jgi:hypothetical protein